MAPDVKSDSWKKSAGARNGNLTGSSRRRLSEAFDKEKKPKGAVKTSPSGPLREMRQFSMSKLKIPNMRTSPTRRALRSGADKLSKTFQQLRVSVNNFSQKLKGRSTRRHRRFENTDTPVATPQTRSRKILGRTPTKLYSPFSIDTTPGGGLASPAVSDTPKRERPYSHRLFNLEQQENQRPMTRSMVQTQAMLTQPSPACKSLLE
ncbi:uncharacterized protein LOC132203646 [Neocloeon triangulifer]|uniref:uncharacterized protein LOC132203646 n=1 Tax=Neocloeon triangulifer TaxID=2078957 RepID=UPI00286F0454|nr:uncharacterized protein LOC132203646 [Neocloeon triangulifer]